MEDRSLVRLKTIRTHVGSVSLRQMVPKKKNASRVRLQDIPAKRILVSIRSIKYYFQGILLCTKRHQYSAKCYNQAGNRLGNTFSLCHKFLCVMLLNWNLTCNNQKTLSNRSYVWAVTKAVTDANACAVSCMSFCFSTYLVRPCKLLSEPILSMTKASSLMGGKRRTVVWMLTVNDIAFNPSKNLSATIYSCDDRSNSFLS